MNGSITLITGTLGGGKTLYAVEEIAHHILRGGFVYTNIALKRDAIKKWIEEQGLCYDDTRVVILDGSSMEAFYSHVGRGTHEMPVMVVFDEAAVAGLNARDWNKQERDMLNFNVLIRKLDIRMLYIVQQAQFIDKQIRALCQVLVDCRNLKYYKIWGIIPLPLPLLIRVHHNLTWGKVAKTHSDVVTKKPEFYALYDSDALLGNAVSKFAQMKVLTGGKLRSIERKSNNYNKQLALFTVCYAFSVSFALQF